MDVSQRMAGSRQLNDTADGEIIKSYSNPTFVLGNGWDPKSAPIMATVPKAIAPARPSPAVTLVTQPANQLALLGTSPYFVVHAKAAGELHYQWRKDGDLIPGANGRDPSFRDPLGGPKKAITQSTFPAARSTTESDSAGAHHRRTHPARPAPKLPSIPSAVFPVTSYGAVADGRTDNHRRPSRRRSMQPLPAKRRHRFFSPPLHSRLPERSRLSSPARSTSRSIPEPRSNPCPILRRISPRRGPIHSPASGTRISSQPTGPTMSRSPAGAPLTETGLPGGRPSLPTTTCRTAPFSSDSTAARRS